MNILSPQALPTLSPKIADTIVEWRDIKICKGCQDKELTVKKWVRGDPYLKDSFNIHSYDLRADIYDAAFADHIFGLKDRIGVFVKHVENHKDCYNYSLKTIPCFYKQLTTNFQLKQIDPKPLHLCPGHEELITHFCTQENTHKRGKIEVKKKLKRANITDANYFFIKRNSQEAKKRDCFKRVSHIHKYALFCVYYHHENSLQCPGHPLHLK